MFTDMVGYTALGQKNESLSLALVEEQRKVIRPILTRHNGREVKTIGDAFLVEFPNAVDSVRCAYDIQRAIREFNLSLAPDKRIHLRVGVHVGEVVESQGDISGDAVNVASRIEPLAEDGGVCITRQVYDFVRNKVDVPLSSMGPKVLKNVAEPMEVYRMIMPWEKESATASGQLDRKRVAVLPFANMSPDPNDEYFADGMTEELISSASLISGLTLIARTSVMGYKGTSKRVEEIGRELGVGTLLEGSVRKSANRLRITVQLIDVGTQGHLWAQSYDRDLQDVFAVQSDIARQVADSLKVRLMPEATRQLNKRPTESSEAHLLYLKGRYSWNERTKESLYRAMEYFKRAVEFDPDYSLAYSGIADCYSVLGGHGYLPFAEAYPKLREYALAAVQRDPASAEARASLGMGLMTDRDFEGAEREFAKAIELNPNYATAHHWLGFHLMNVGSLEPALSEATKARDLDPLSPQIASFLGVIYDALKIYDLAEKQQRKALELQSDFLPAHGNLCGTFMHQRRWEDAKKEVAEYQRISKDTHGSKLYLAAILMYEGRVEEARATMAEAETIPATGSDDAGPRILYHLAAGDREQAVTLILKEYEAGAEWLGTIAFDPLLEGLRTDPRVAEVLRKMGIRKAAPLHE
jgi:TolB-like protein/Flp pilus assembly protein TadD